jgi:membrane-associated phospholipid phosphatase
MMAGKKPHTTCRLCAWWITSFVAAVLLILAVKHYAFFPPDIAVERWVQSVVPQDLKWAERVSHTAEFPFIGIILGLVFVLSRRIAGWRAAFCSLVSFAGMVALGTWLGPMIGRPRPSAELVHLFRPYAGFGFPSLFALRYAATFGFIAVLAMGKRSGPVRAVILILCAILLGLGWVARVSLGAHWPSDVIISYYIGILSAAFVIRLGGYGFRLK